METPLINREKSCRDYLSLILCYRSVNYVNRRTSVVTVTPAVAGIYYIRVDCLLPLASLQISVLTGQLQILTKLQAAQVTITIKDHICMMYVHYVLFTNYVIIILHCNGGGTKRLHQIQYGRWIWLNHSIDKESKKILTFTCEKD